MTGGTAISSMITDDGYNVYSGGTASAAQVGSGGTQYVYDDGLAVGAG